MGCPCQNSPAYLASFTEKFDLLWKFPTAGFEDVVIHIKEANLKVPLSIHNF